MKYKTYQKHIKLKILLCDNDAWHFSELILDKEIFLVCCDLSLEMWISISFFYACKLNGFGSLLRFLKGNKIKEGENPQNSSLFESFWHLRVLCVEYCGWLQMHLFLNRFSMLRLMSFSENYYSFHFFLKSLKTTKITIKKTWIKTDIDMQNKCI